MSEHLEVKGVVNYSHLPLDESGAFTYCNNCKETCERIIVEFHQGWLNDWMCVRCSKCKKSIWTAKLNRKITKDNKKCAVCGSPTNWIDCVSHGSFLAEKKERYICSNKCYSKERELDNKVLFYSEELNLNFKEQNVKWSENAELFYKIARELAKC